MRDAFNRSLRSSKVAEGIRIQCIRLASTNSADLVFLFDEKQSWDERASEMAHISDIRGPVGSNGDR
jgi:hypothetical protein